MAAIRHLCRQKLLSRLISSRKIPYRCSLAAENTAIQSQTFLYYTHPASSRSTRFHAGRNKSDGERDPRKAIHGENCASYNNYLPSSDLFSRTSRTFPVPQTYVTCTKNIHTTARLNVLLPPHVWLFIKPVQKLLAIILGRSVRKWWRALPANKRRLFKESVRRSKWKLSLGAGALGFLIILFYFTNLEETPVTGRTRLLVFRKEHYDLLTTLEYESENGDAVLDPYHTENTVKDPPYRFSAPEDYLIKCLKHLHVLIEEFKDTMLPEDDTSYQVVQKIVDLLISGNSDLPEVSKIEWAVHVVNNPVVNAFVLPNGQVFVFTGMLNAVADHHQLAFILGHEMAHAILEHTVEKASVSHFLDFLFLISLAMIWALCPMDSLAVVGQWIQSKLREFMFERPFSRTLEAEADKVGLELAAKACVDVRASSVFWKQMEVTETLGGQPRIPEWLSTHPSHENRAEHLDRLIPKALKLRESCDCPALPSVDPRFIFELSVKRLLQNSRDQEIKAITGDLVSLPVDDRVPLAAALKAN